MELPHPPKEKSDITVHADDCSVEPTEQVHGLSDIRINNRSKKNEGRALLDSSDQQKIRQEEIKKLERLIEEAQPVADELREKLKIANLNNDLASRDEILTDYARYLNHINRLEKRIRELKIITH